MSFNTFKTPFAGVALKSDPSLEVLFDQQQQQQRQQGFGQQCLVGVILDNLLGGPKSTQCTETNLRCDVVETEQFYYVMLELPGILLQDINIEIVEAGGSSLSTLTVSCDRKVQPFDDSSASYLQKETSNGRLQRTFALPKDAAATQASAKLNLAVLTITIPRTAQVVSQGRRIIAISSEPLQQQQGQQRGSQPQQQPQQQGQQQRPSQGQSDGTPSSQRGKK